MAKANKAIATHPRSGREMNMDAAIYEPFKAAILQSLQTSKGKTFTELTDDVVKIIHKKMPGFTKSIPWYTISIRLDLETKGLVETFTEKGKRLNRLKNHEGIPENWKQKSNCQNFIHIIIRSRGLMV